jgi:hypothetical protein
MTAITPIRPDELEAQAARAMLAALVELQASLTAFPKRMLYQDMVELAAAAIAQAEAAGIKAEG